MVYNSDHCTDMRAHIAGVHACAGLINFHIKVAASIDLTLVRMENREGACLVDLSPACSRNPFSAAEVRAFWKRRENEKERDETYVEREMESRGEQRGESGNKSEREREMAPHTSAL